MELRQPTFIDGNNNILASMKYSMRVFVSGKMFPFMDVRFAAPFAVSST